MTKHHLEMACEWFTLPVALSMLEIPLPEDDDRSEGGYIDLDEVSAVMALMLQIVMTTRIVNLMNMYHPSHPSSNLFVLLSMLDKSPLDFFQVSCY